MTKKRYADRITGKDVSNEYEFRYIRKNGVVGWVSMNVGLIELEGDPALIGTLFDITVRKKAEEDLAEEKEFLSVTMASIGDGVVSTDTTGSIISINPSPFRLPGFNSMTPWENIWMMFSTSSMKNRARVRWAWSGSCSSSTESGPWRFGAVYG